MPLTVVGIEDFRFFSEHFGVSLKKYFCYVHYFRKYDLIT